MIPRGDFIYFLKAQKLIAKGCLHHLVQLRDLKAKKHMSTL